MESNQDTAQYGWSDFASTLRSRWPLVLLTFSVVFLAGAWHTGQRPEVFESAAVVEIGEGMPEELVPRAATEVRPVFRDEVRRALLALESGDVLLGVVDEADLAGRWGAKDRVEALAVLRGRVNFSAEESGVIRVRVRAWNAEESAELAQRIADRFVRKEEEKFRSGVENQIRRFTEELESRRDEVEVIERRLVALKSGVDDAAGASREEQKDLRRNLVEETHVIRSLEAKRQRAVVELQEIQPNVAVLESPAAGEARQLTNRRAALALYCVAGLLLGVVVVGITGVVKAPAAETDLAGRRLESLLVSAVPVPDVSLLGTEAPSVEVVEPYRSLRERVHRLPAGESMMLAFVPDHDEGKAPDVVANLAAVTAAAGHTVLVIDGNFREPRMHELFGAAHHPGLSDFLTGEMRIEETVIRTRQSNLWFLPSGTAPGDAAGLLSGKRMQDLVWDMKRRFDYLLVTTPRARGWADAGILSGYADHTILVSSGRRPVVSRLERTSRVLRDFGAEISGVILGRAVSVPATRPEVDPGRGKGSVAGKVRKKRPIFVARW